MLARTIMVQGTASSVGKSLLATALCRLFARAGYRVVPFKAQNMALNSFVTPDGGEIGRAQAVQAEAARIAPSIEMNPVLLKPEGNARSQVVVLGKPIGSMTAAEYHEYKPELRRIIAESLTYLRERSDLVVIEGAGSPAEINLKDRDIVNMHVAKIADAPVLLVGDIDRGGVFAAFVGTMELLEPDERRRIAAFVVNKFRGDVSLLTPGLEFLRKRTGVPVLGVVPYMQTLRIADEDSVSLEDRVGRQPPKANELDIVVVRLPRVSNYDDFNPLEHEEGVVVRFVETPEVIRGADLVVLPGSKCTVIDLKWLRQRGIARAIDERAAAGGLVLGICGGCQMLGESIHDPYGVESAEPTVLGLGLLPLRTHFEQLKTTAQIRARVACPSFLTDEVTKEEELSGYEIHMGQVEKSPEAVAPFEILTRNGRQARSPDGAINDSGVVVGTMIHGIFENIAVRSSLLDHLRDRKGLRRSCTSTITSREDEYDRLAKVFREHIQEETLYRLAKLRRLDLQGRRDDTEPERTTFVLGGSSDGPRRD
jgi:adenosylcobyric acid synthase